MSGTLYLVATPIGNLGDFSPRAAETLGAVDFIAAEDTRVSVKLLNHFQIKKPLVSYHEHNHAAAGQAILQRLLAGESCALVTDAGTPAISDPGEDLVRLCAENGVEVLSIPGCCAAVNALAVRLVTKIRDSVNFFISYKLCDFLDQSCFVDHIWKFGHNNTVFTILHRLDIGDRTNSDFSTSGAVSFVNSGCSKNHRSSWKIRTFYNTQQFFDICLAVL